MKKGRKLLVKEMINENVLNDIRKNIINRVVTTINNKSIICIHGEYGVGIKDIVYKALDILGIQTVLYTYREDRYTFHKMVNRVKRMVDRETINKALPVHVIIDNMYLNRSILNKLKSKVVDNYPAKLIILSPYRINAELVREYDGEAIEIKPLTFREYLAYKGIKVGEFPLDYQKLKMLYIENIDLSKEFEEYLQNGGLNVLVGRGFRNRREYINTLSEILEQMINLSVQLSKKRDYELMKSLISYLYLNPGTPIYYNKLSEMIGKDVRSLTNYLKNAYNTYLLLQLKNLASGRRRARSNIKIYPYNHILTYPIHMGRIEDEIYMGKVLGGLIARSIGARYFWARGGKEIDLIWERDGETIPVSIRYIKRLTRREIKKVETGFRKMGAKMGILVSKDIFDYVKKDVEIYILPMWLFLLIA